MIVINGVPVDRTNYNGSTVSVNGGGVYSDGGDAFASINPDDIESMTILKGAPAAAHPGTHVRTTAGAPYCPAHGSGLREGIASVTWGMPLRGDKQLKCR